MYEIVRLSKVPHANAYVRRYDNGDVWLISYTTAVAKITHDGLLYVSGLYSATTRRHLSAFMQEYGNGHDYYYAKECYKSGQPFYI